MTVKKDDEIGPPPANDSRVADLSQLSVEEKQDVVNELVNQMPPETHRLLLARQVQQLPVPQQQDLFAAQVQQLPAGQQQQWLEAQVQQLSAKEHQKLVETQAQKLPAAQQQQLANRLFQQPSQWAANVIWLAVLLILGGVIFLFGWQAIENEASDETALYGFVGLALGGVLGLIAPAPPVISKSQTPPTTT